MQAAARMSHKPSEDLEKVKRLIRSLLLSSKNGLSEKQLVRDYLMVTGERLNHHVFGYQSLMSFLRSMPDVVRMAPDRVCGVMLYGVAGENKDIQRVASLVARNKATKPYLNIKGTQTRPAAPPPRSIPPSVKLKFRTLMLSYPNGMPMEKFLDAFAQRFGYYLNLTQCGFSSVHAALTTLPDVVKLEYNEKLQQYYVKSVQQPPRICECVCMCDLRVHVFNYAA